MRKLLFSSLILAACGASESSINSSNHNVNDTSIVVLIDSLGLDSVRAITHGSPEQEKLDSMKNAKGQEKKMDLF